MNYETGYHELLAQNTNQAQQILELNEQVWGLQKQAQDKEGYIHDLMCVHQLTLRAILKLEIPAVNDIIATPPTSVAAEREKRLEVFKK